MIKIECDSVLFGDGHGIVEGKIQTTGPRENLSYEIYTIFKWFETNCTEPYTDAIQKIYEEAGV